MSTGPGDTIKDDETVAHGEAGVAGLPRLQLFRLPPGSQTQRPLPLDRSLRLRSRAL